MKKTISIIGCGWLGLPLGRVLSENSYEVQGSTTTTEKLAKIAAAGIKPFHLELPLISRCREFFNTDILIITLPPSTANYESSINALLQMIDDHKISNIIFISSTSVYPNTNTDVFEEDAENITSPHSGTNLLEIENRFRELSPSATIIRFAGLYGPGREPGRFLAGLKGLKGGLNPVNMIHLDDCIGVIEKVISADAWGQIFNACAPIHPDKISFYTRACASANLEVPEFLLGNTPHKIVNSSKLISTLGYTFKHPDPGVALVV